eukprot:7388782-Prymnesium_polylepis.1
MLTPPEGWPKEATYPPTRDDRRMYQAFSESIDNKTVTVQFIPAYGGGRFIVPKQEEEPEIDFEEEEYDPDDKLDFMPSNDSDEVLMEQIGKDGDNFDITRLNEPGWKATPPQCPRSRPEYPSLNDGNQPCTVNTTRNIGGGTKPKYRYMCQLCKFEWQQEREINKWTREKRKALEQDILITDPTWL